MHVRPRGSRGSTPRTSIRDIESSSERWCGWKSRPRGSRRRRSPPAIGRQARHVAGRSRGGNEPRPRLHRQRPGRTACPRGARRDEPARGAGRRTSVQTFELLMDDSWASAHAGGGSPLRDFLKHPGVAVGVGEVRERPIVTVLGVGAGPPLERVAVEVAHLAHLHTAGDELIARRLDVPDDEVRPAIRPGRRVRDADADRDRACRPRRRHLHDPEPLARLVVDVEGEPQLLRIERLRPVDVRDRDEHELELQSHVATLLPRWQLLHRPAIAVRVAEEHERAPRGSCTSLTSTPRAASAACAA